MLTKLSKLITILNLNQNFQIWKSIGEANFSDFSLRIWIEIFQVAEVSFHPFLDTLIRNFGTLVWSPLSMKCLQFSIWIKMPFINLCFEKGKKVLNIENYFFKISCLKNGWMWYFFETQKLPKVETFCAQNMNLNAWLDTRYLFSIFSDFFAQK